MLAEYEKISLTLDQIQEWLTLKKGKRRKKRQKQKQNCKIILQ